MPNEIVINVRAVDDGKLDKIGKDAERTGKRVGKGMEKGFKEAEDASTKASRKITDNNEKIGDSARKAAKETEGAFSSAFSDKLSGLGGDLFSGLGDAMSGGAGMLAAGGALLGGALMTGIEQAVEEKRIGGLLAAQLGGGREDAARYGRLAGEVYGDNFGDSLEHVGEAMRGVLTEGLVDPSSSDAQIRQVTEQVLTVSQTIGEETERISRSARTMLVNGMADSAREAFDMITHASQEGINTAGDLLDTIDEYSGQFSRLGLEGADSMGLLSQALKGGARDADYAADAIKEFAIRAQDMSPTTARGFRTIGLDAQAMGQRIAQGGDTARYALDATLDGLRNIHDPILRNQAAVDLFGTKAEDLGQALFDMDLDSAAEDFGDFAGATADAADRLGEAAPVWENMGRNITSFLGDMAQGQDVLDNLYDNMDARSKDVLAAAREFKATGDTSALDALKEKYPEIAGEIDNFAEKQRDATDTVEQSSEAVAVYVETLSDLIEKNKELSGGVSDLIEAQSGYEDAVDSAQEAIEKNGKTTDMSTEAGRDNVEMLMNLKDKAYDAAAAMETQGASTQDVQAHMKRARTDFLNLATAMGMDATKAAQLANKLGLIPGNYTANVVVRTAQATQMINNLIRRIDQMPTEKQINLRVNTSYSGMGGHQLPGQAHGGAASSSSYGHAAEGGARGDLTMVNEQGPELQRLQNGSIVVPAGMSRSLFDGARTKLGGGTPGKFEIIFSGATDSAYAQAFQQLVRRGLIRLSVNNTPVTVG